MAIQSIVEQWEGRTCSKSLDKYNRKYQRKFKVVCTTDASDDINVILADGRLPVIGSSTYPTDNGALCLTVQVQQHQKFYDLTYGYDSEVPVPSQQAEDPTARPAVYSTSFQKIERPLIEDLDGEPIINTAGQPFEAPITVPASLLLIQIEKNYAIGSKDLTDFADLVDTINDATWITGIGDFDEFTCRMDSIEVKQAFENDVEYWAVNYKILFNPEPWFPVKILNCGFAEIALATGLLTQLTDATGAPLSKPQLLDATGQKTATPYYLEFDVYEKVNWSSVP